MVEGTTWYSENPYPTILDLLFNWNALNWNEPILSLSQHFCLWTFLVQNPVHFKLNPPHILSMENALMLCHLRLNWIRMMYSFFENLKYILNFRISIHHANYKLYKQHIQTTIIRLAKTKFVIFICFILSFM